MCAYPVVRGTMGSAMDELALRVLLDDLRAGVIDSDEAVRLLRRLPFADLGYARIDHHRALRQGFPEAVYAPGKSPEQCAGIVAELLSEDGSTPVMLSRADDTQAAAALAANPEVRAGPAPWCGDRPRAGPRRC